MDDAKKIDPQTLSRVAEIARLKLSDEDCRAFEKDLNSILDSFSLINEIQAKGEGLYYVREVQSLLRKDAAKQFDGAAEIRGQFSKRKQSGEMLAPKSL